jgi:hypothetical protein
VAITTPGEITLVGPSAASASIGGKLMTTMGRGVANTRVTLTGTNGAIRTTISNSFGYYRFTGLEIGQTYVLSVASKGYTFSPQAVSLVENITNLDLIAQQ